MSECVVRMEMPTRCDLCDLWRVCKNVADFGKARYFEEPRELFVGMKGCKIVCPLPEGHGRLGDLDALADDVRSLWDYKTVDGITATTVLNQTLTDIRNCPTIVPAETERREICLD